LKYGWFNVGPKVPSKASEQVHVFFDQPPNTEPQVVLYHDKQGLFELDVESLINGIGRLGSLWSLRVSNAEGLVL
jgi:hypothetical protein